MSDVNSGTVGDPTCTMLTKTAHTTNKKNRILNTKTVFSNISLMKRELKILNHKFEFNVILMLLYQKFVLGLVAFKATNSYHFIAFSNIKTDKI